MAAREVTVAKLPACNIHEGRPAVYDFRTLQGLWMYGCEECYRAYGRGLGVGLGQRLVVRPEEPKP